MIIKLETYESTHCIQNPWYTEYSTCCVSCQAKTMKPNKPSARTNTVGRVLTAWFNDCVLGKSGQIANPIIAMVDPVLCYSICAHLCLRIY